VGDTDELLSWLVDKSLLQPVGGGTRLRMLETIREYGAGQLAERGEADQARRRHAAYYSDLMNDAMPRLLTRNQLTWLAAVEADRDNVLTALRYWCEAEEAGRAITLAVSVSSLAFLLGNQADISEWIGHAVVVPGEADPDMRTVADVLNSLMKTIGPDGEAGQLDSGLTDSVLADRVEALALGAFPLAGLLRPAYAILTQDTERGRRYIDEALASQDEWLVAGAWMLSAAFAENVGDVDAMRAAAAQALNRFRVLGERWGLSSALRITGGVRMRDGDLDGAAAAFAEAGRVLAELGSRDDEANLRLQLAEIAARRGDLDAARGYYAAARDAAESAGPGMDLAIASSSSAMFEAMLGDVAAARPLHAAAREWLTLSSPGHPAHHPIAAAVAAAGVIIAIADADLPLARACAAEAYREGIAAEDMTHFAGIAGVLAYLAHGLGQPDRAAQMLGACTAVRGGEDPTSLPLTQLGPRLREVLGEERYARAYATGRGLDRAEAILRLDPATLGSDPARVPAHRQREEDNQHAGDPRERPADL
jgi:hypothetical protein